ncbi:MAG: energy-coupling factor transporter transmembrane protein EcfT [Methanolinea sp.]|nr:energy-coupling factor transporter transmembrane protein EcfT [Methanolinea sp.]
MEDPRIRLFSVIAISICAFLSTGGAVLALAWWGILTPGPRLLLRSPAPLWTFVPVGLVSVLIVITGGDGISYLIRMAAIVLVASYAFQVRKPGEFLHVCGWLMGNQTGFDIGLSGEIGLSSLELLERDLSRIRAAMQLKGMSLSRKTFGPIAAGIVVRLLASSEDQADLLYTRGYSAGGTACPRFTRRTLDFIPFFAAIFFLILSFLEVRDIFILLQ